LNQEREAKKKEELLSKGRKFNSGSGDIMSKKITSDFVITKMTYDYSGKVIMIKPVKDKR